MTIITMNANSIVSYDNIESLLSSKNWDKQYTPVPNKYIGTVLKAQFQHIFETLGETFNEDDSLLTVQAQDGNYVRLFSPTVYLCSNEQLAESAYGKANPSLFSAETESIPEDAFEKAKTPEQIKALEKLVSSGRDIGVRFGAKLFVPLKAFKTIEGCEIALDGGDIEFTFPESDTFPEGLTVKFSVRYREPDLEKRKSQETVFKRAFSKYLKNQENNLGLFIDCPPSGGGSGIPLREIEEHSEHTIVGYEFKESSNGGFYLLTCENGIKIMGNRAIATTLRANPIITPDKPATLRVNDKKKMQNGNWKVNAALLIPSENYPSSDGVILDW